MAVKNLLTYFKKPVFLAAIICSFVFYSGLYVFPKRTGIFSILEDSQISNVSGKILSSPSKTTSGKYYSAIFSVSEVSNQFQIN